MKFPLLKTVVTAFTILTLSACAFDKDDVTDEQEKRDARERRDIEEKIQAIVGAYSGTMRIGDSQYDLLMTFNSVPTGTDNKPKVLARVKRSDLISTDANLEGTFFYTEGLLKMAAPAGSSLEKNAIKALDAQVSGDFISGDLFTGNDKLGRFEVKKDPGLPTNLDLVGLCHPFYQGFRERISEITGDYKAVVNPDPSRFPAYTVNLRITTQSENTLNLIAEHSASNIPELPKTLNVSYDPHLSGGTLTMLSLDGSAIRADLRRGEKRTLTGKLTYSTGRSFDVTFKKTQDLPLKSCQ